MTTLRNLSPLILIISILVAATIGSAALLPVPALEYR